MGAIVSTPTAEMKEIHNEDHYICATGGFTGEPGGIVFFSIFVFYGALLVLLGIFLTVVTRKVPAQFNEGKLMAICIYNLAFFMVVIIPVFMVIQEYNAYIAWIIRTCAIIYGFTATLVVQFVPPLFGIIVIDKCKNVKVFRSQLNSSSALNGKSTSDDTPSQTAYSL